MYTVEEYHRAFDEPSNSKTQQTLESKMEKDAKRKIRQNGIARLSKKN